MKAKRSIQQLMIGITIFGLIPLACQGATGFSLFATETPTPTNTFTPTLTFTITPSPTATRTPTSTPRPTGVTIDKQTDGTSLIIDYDNKYQLLLPVNWKVVFTTQEDLQKAIQQISEGDPDFAQITESFKDVDPTVFRLSAVNTDRSYMGIDSPPLLTVNAFADPIASTMPMAFVTAMIEDNILQGASSTSWDVIDNLNQVEVGTVRGKVAIQIPNGPSITMQELVIAFQSNNKLIVVEVAAPNEFGEQVLAPFDKIIDSIQANIQ